MKYIKICTVLLLVATINYAQTGGNFSIDKSVIASGGGNSDGGGFALSGTIGQANAANKSTGGDFALSGGFWHGSINNDIIFKHGFES